MGAEQSKEELVYQQVNYGNVEGIKDLRRKGAGLEYVDNEGKTPLILACLRADLLHVAETLIQLGANVNAYRPGSHAGTPLHHAAKRGLDQTVALLLSHGANPLVMNDDCETALDLARAKGHVHVVRMIENYICLFSGWLRELYGPSFLEAFAPQWVSRKIWAVVLPCDSRNLMNPSKFDLAIYPDLQAAQPRTRVALWKAQIEEPKFNQADPALLIVDKATKSRFKFLAALEGDKQQLQRFYDACKGIRSHIGNPSTPAGLPVTNQLQSNPQASTAPAAAGAPIPGEDVELAMAINASIQSAIAEGIPPLTDVQPNTNSTNTNGWGNPSSNASYNGWGMPDATPSSKNAQTQAVETPASSSYNGWAAAPQSQMNNPPNTQSMTEAPPVPSATPSATPSAPPVPDDEFYNGPIQYPSIDTTPVNLTVPPLDIQSGKQGAKDSSSGNDDSSGSCVICLDAPVEGACIPCGHMAGCMSCLKEIKAKKWGCPVCRAKIDQVIRLYAV
ncbi:probable E3 ubiquitin-protein ligase XBOS34 [Dioscorea cayenensis subsp. rotundata]|uniref:Probable E3 ubiquitin-protein ligase XBOS34 n=1 Tax=Dioscorea cayennensis subsp. rotundata TaxID=55577 RepID=A0AB40APH8_DIOCR|nr:probable E3 ubiquitin-protein ligase XBOS34 [Dioscorea cayenensis subsp. rotundata]